MVDFPVPAKSWLTRATLVTWHAGRPLDCWRRLTEAFPGHGCVRRLYILAPPILVSRSQLTVTALSRDRTESLLERTRDVRGCRLHCQLVISASTLPGARITAKRMHF